MSDRTPRRWLTFSLRSMFVLTLVAAAYFAGWRSANWRAEREKSEAVRKAFEELQAARKKADREDRFLPPVGGGLVGNVEVYTLPDTEVIRTGGRETEQPDEAPPTRAPQERR